jgi:dihydropteroate synthase
VHELAFTQSIILVAVLASKPKPVLRAVDQEAKMINDIQGVLIGRESSAVGEPESNIYRTDL